MEDLAILELALAYSWSLPRTISLSLRFPGAFFGRLPFPITTVLSVGVIFDSEVAEVWEVWVEEDGETEEDRAVVGNDRVGKDEVASCWRILKY